jgi:hypothetical protein
MKGNQNYSSSSTAASLCEDLAEFVLYIDRQILCLPCQMSGNQKTALMARHARDSLLLTNPTERSTLLALLFAFQKPYKTTIYCLLLPCLSSKTRKHPGPWTRVCSFNKWVFFLPVMGALPVSPRNRHPKGSCSALCSFWHYLKATVE